MGTGSNDKSDLYTLYNVMQNTLFRYTKEMIIATLRDVFSNDSYYHYVADEWGFPKTPDHTDLPIGSGLNDDLTTRLYIGEAFRNNVKFYPAILVKGGSSREIPLSFERDQGGVQWTTTVYQDGYGNQKVFSTPSHIIRAGRWEGEVSIEIFSRSSGARDELAGLVHMILREIRAIELYRAGIVIRPVTINTPSEEEDRVDKIYKQTITVPIFTEWRRHIPISSVIEQINLCVDIGNTSTGVYAPNIEINTIATLLSSLNKI